MQIDDKTANNEIEFHRVPNGKVFFFEDAYYLAIDILEDRDGNSVNAINLSEGDGEGTYFDDEDIVLLVKATLTIESR